MTMSALRAQLKTTQTQMDKTQANIFINLSTHAQHITTRYTEVTTKERGMFPVDTFR